MKPAATNSVCRFCVLAEGGSLAAYDEPLVSSDHFLVVPSLGGFVEGWLLVVSRDHILNLRAMPTTYRDEFEAVVDQASERVRSRYGPYIRFEHGPGRCGSPAGCSIDHAHLHIVPHGQQVVDAIAAETEARLAFMPVGSLFDDVAAQENDSYIYVEEPDGRRYVAFSPDIESQLVRRVLARRAGRGSRFDWRQDLALENVDRTRAALTIA